jgi:glycosyltransferase involved in cell wall biosynthesis
MADGLPLRVVVDGSPLCDGRRMAGIGRYAAALTSALARREDVSLEVVTPRRAPRSEARPLRWLHAQPTLLTRLLRRRPQLVHALASEPVIGWPLRRQVVTVHDVVPWVSLAGGARPELRAYFAFQRRRLRHCAALICVSQVVADEAVDLLGAQRSRVHVVGEAAAKVFHATAGSDDVERRRQAGVPDSGYLLWVGSLRAPDPRKQLDLLVDAAAVAVNGREIALVLAGERGDEADRVVARARQRGLDVTTTGYVDDRTLGALYRGAATLVLPSSHEGFGLTALEAMACGTAVVASRAGNLADLVEGAGLLVPPRDEAALAAAIATIVDNAELRRRLGQAGPGRAAQRSWDGVAERTVAVYRAAMEPRAEG